MWSGAEVCGAERLRQHGVHAPRALGGEDHEVRGGMLGEQLAAAAAGHDHGALLTAQLLVAAQDNADDRTPAATPWLPDGAMLVYPRRVAASITVLQQPTLTEEQLAELREFAVSAADRIAGPIYRATTKDCEGTGRACLCPACRAGEQVV